MVIRMNIKWYIEKLKEVIDDTLDNDTVILRKSKAMKIIKDEHLFNKIMIELRKNNYIRDYQIEIKREKVGEHVFTKIRKVILMSL